MRMRGWKDRIGAWKKLSSEERRFWINTVVGVATVIVSVFLSLLGSWLLVSIQLERDHAFTVQQTAVAHRQFIAEEKMELYRETVRLTGLMKWRFEKVVGMIGGVLNMAIEGYKSELDKETLALKLMDDVLSDMTGLAETKAEFDAVMKKVEHCFGSEVRDAIAAQQSESEWKLNLDELVFLGRTGQQEKVKEAVALIIDGDKKGAEETLEYALNNDKKQAEKLTGLLTDLVDESTAKFQAVVDAMSAEISADRLAAI